MRETFLKIAYLLAALPLALIYFTVLSIAFAWGVVMLVTWLANPYWTGVLVGARKLAHFERRLANFMLKAEIAAPVEIGAVQLSRSERLWSLIRDLATWRSLGFLLAKLPFAVLLFTLTLSLLITTLGLLVAFFAQVVTPGVVPISFFAWQVQTVPQAVTIFTFGLVFGFLSLLAVNALSCAARKFAECMLSARGIAGTKIALAD